MDSAQLRSHYLEFFANHGHRIVPSSPVIPHGDPTLLFTNAGMNQFKEVLLGREIRDYKRATSVQKCIRAGGKHNDLDEVGKDGRHLTCFEMLGNWSFGDYYKKEAICWAWEFVTQVLQLDRDRLYAATYKDDEESRQIWRDLVGLEPHRIASFGDVARGDEENFWSMGPTGPCGPCTEIYYDHHPEHGPFQWKAGGFDEERVLELWNLVFMEFDRDEQGQLSPLPMKSVDTGMGLERTVAVLEQVDNVFFTDVFEPIILETAHLLGESDTDPQRLFRHPQFTAFAVIADHLRALCFSLADGGMFSNEGRGYVLRRILRRAVRFGRMLGFTEPFLCRISKVVSRQFGDVYPEVGATAKEIAEMIRIEEERFFRTIDRGIARFAEVASTTRAANQTAIDGREAFKLYDTYGFPLDLTQIMAEEQGLAVDTAAFNAALAEQQERARHHDTRYADSGDWIAIHEGVADRSLAWLSTRYTTRILRLRENEQSGTWEILLAETPFYAEAGGQVGDTGFIRHGGDQFRFEVTDTIHTPAGITHLARLTAGVPTLEHLRDPVIAEVDAERRALTTSNHTATHLLHAALHEIVSPQAFQAGSLVNPERMRFDYSFHRPLTPQEIHQIEEHVNDNIRKGIDLVIHQDIPRTQAESMGAIAIFGEKYGDRVRVVQVPGVSIELCGGCHVRNTSDIMCFRITSETGVAAGVRRIEAVTNRAAFARAREDQRLLEELTALLKTDQPNLANRAAKLLEEQQTLLRRNQQLAQKLAEFNSQHIIAAQARRLGEVTVAAARVEAASREELLFFIDALRPKLVGPATALVGALVEGKPALACLASEELVRRFGLKAGDLINLVAPIIGGRGGGRPTLAQAGGSRPELLDQAIEAFVGKVGELLGQAKADGR
ncbi:MAG: alanine--tRNA ligase [Bradymonadales bacterium]|nr:alanine--tRNA ligase [Bradymonadales bacterium]